MEVALRSDGNNGAARLERVLVSMAESVLVAFALIAGKSLVCFLTEATNTLGTGAEVFTGLHVAVMMKKKTEPENKDAGDSEEDEEDDDDDEDAVDDQDDEGDDSGDDGNDDEGDDSGGDDPEANGEGGSDDDEDDDDDDEDEDEDDDEEEDEEEDEDTPQPPAKKRK